MPPYRTGGGDGQRHAGGRHGSGERARTGPTRGRPAAPAVRLSERRRRGRTGFRMTRSDRGAASVWVLAAGLVLVLAGGFGAAIGSATVARHRAQAAADLGALAGAARAVYGTG